MKKNFIHLHVHSEYSLLDGSTRIKDLIGKTVEYGMPAIALTDHGVMYGIIEFYKTAVNSGIKPIIGCEIYQAPNSRWNKQLEKENREEVSNHLTLLVENKTGYKNLMKLVSLGFIEGFYYKPRVDSELLAQYKDGIIALSGCISGKIPHYIQSGKISEAEKAIEEYI
ncbi:MAG: PHP domain-containing protein, partial [Actinobacteria bacterium]|nr:PHP domain-containing protein [Actinomycetota bacterium]